MRQDPGDEPPIAQGHRRRSRCLLQRHNRLDYHGVQRTGKDFREALDPTR